MEYLPQGTESLQQHINKSFVSLDAAEGLPDLSRPNSGRNAPVRAICKLLTATIELRQRRSLFLELLGQGVLSYELR